MIPLEIKEDRHGLLYINSKDLDIKENSINHDFNNTNGYYFISIPSTDEYIIKYSKEVSKENSLLLKRMLCEFNKIRLKIDDIDFPIGYYIDDNIIKGIVIYYYKHAISLKDFSEKYDIEDLTKFYYYDDNVFHNLTLLYDEILLKHEKMFDEKIYYLDVNSGNFVLYQNKVKVIDFEPNLMIFGKDNYYYRRVLGCFKMMINIINCSLGYEDVMINNSENINCLKKEIRKMSSMYKKG